VKKKMTTRIIGALLVFVLMISAVLSTVERMHLEVYVDVYTPYELSEDLLDLWVNTMKTINVTTEQLISSNLRGRTGYLSTPARNMLYFYEYATMESHQGVFNWRTDEQNKQYELLSMVIINLNYTLLNMLQTCNSVRTSGGSNVITTWSAPHPLGSEFFNIGFSTEEYIPLLDVILAFTGISHDMVEVRVVGTTCGWFD